jgi:hypothetical protein
MNHTTTRRSAIVRSLAALGAGALPAGLALAQAQDYPNRTIRIIVPFGPGGPSDLISRLIAQKLTDSMKQPVIIENKPGASGIVGADLVAKAPPDGYTLLVINQLLVQVSALYAKVPFDPLNDFIPLTDIFSSPLWLAVNTTKTNATTMKDFVAQVKAQPKTHSYASVGAGSIGSLYGFKLNEVAKTHCGPIMAISGHNVMIGKRTWARLPADIQKIMLEEGKATQEAYLKWVTEFEAKAVENIKAQGGRVVPMSAEELKKWRAASPDFIADWEKATAAATGDADTPRKVAARWRQLLAQ